MTPFVEGAWPPRRGSGPTASPRARPRALNTASARWWSSAPARRLAWRVRRPSLARERRRWPMSSVAMPPSLCPPKERSRAAWPRPPRSRATRARASSMGTRAWARQTIPVLSLRASWRARPRAMPTSSTRWSRMPMPVATSARPEPSSRISTSTWVSLVWRRHIPFLIRAWPPAGLVGVAGGQPSPSLDNAKLSSYLSQGGPQDIGVLREPDSDTEAVGDGGLVEVADEDAPPGQPLPHGSGPGPPDSAEEEVGSGRGGGDGGP